MLRERDLLIRRAGNIISHQPVKRISSIQLRSDAIYGLQFVGGSPVGNRWAGVVSGHALKYTEFFIMYLLLNEGVVLCGQI